MPPRRQLPMPQPVQQLPPLTLGGMLSSETQRVNTLTMLDIQGRLPVARPRGVGQEGVDMLI